MERTRSVTSRFYPVLDRTHSPARLTRHTWHSPVRHTRPSKKPARRAEVERARTRTLHSYPMQDTTFGPARLTRLSATTPTMPMPRRYQPLRQLSPRPLPIEQPEQARPRHLNLVHSASTLATPSLPTSSPLRSTEYDVDGHAPLSFQPSQLQTAKVTLHQPTKHASHTADPPSRRAAKQPATDPRRMRPYRQIMKPHTEVVGTTLLRQCPQDLITGQTRSMTPPSRSPGPRARQATTPKLVRIAGAQPNFGVATTAVADCSDAIIARRTDTARIAAPATAISAARSTRPDAHAGHSQTLPNACALPLATLVKPSRLARRRQCAYHSKGRATC